MKDKVEFKDLSWQLKFAVVIGWVFGIGWGLIILGFLLSELRVIA